MRKKIIAANWKMNMTPAEAARFAGELVPLVDVPEVDVVICAPFVLFGAVWVNAEGTTVALGAQNMHYEDKGAFTGEISADMLSAVQVSHVIIGHSERRQYFNETDCTVNKKVKKALSAGIAPIMCCGESLLQREMGITIEHIRMQIKLGLLDVSAGDAAKVVIAYEPIWAIGTGVTATTAQAEEACAAIRQVLTEIYDKSTADKIRIQYGGSVTPANAAELFAQPNIDGALVGGASLSLDFAKIVEAAK
ncbi:MAG: triose-phosphate isomerase [Defluviitaleaceae bacterium]|nr:triose-phosphate isomerase [Defluviitaleaceae bacterium]